MRTWHSRAISVVTLILGTLVTVAASPSPVPLPAPSTAPSRMHLRLVRATPAIDSTFVGSPSTISLWFSEPVRLKATSVKIMDSKGALVTIGALARDTAETVRVFAKVPKVMAPGRYTVTWRAMGHDSHVVKGKYTFTLTASKGR